MPTYTWACYDCETGWERDYRMGKAPKKTKCAECGKLCERSYDTPSIKFIGSGFYCNDYGANTWTHKNFKSSADHFIKEAKKSSEKRMDTGFQHYKVFTPDLEVLEKRGEIKKSKGNADEVIEKKARNYREVAQQIYKESDIDPTTQTKTNVDIMTTPDKKGLE